MVDGLSTLEARKRLKEHGPNRIKPQRKTGAFYLFFSQLKSPLTLLLLFAALIAFFLKDFTDAYIIFGIVGVSAALGFYQEKKSSDAIRDLLQMVSIQVDVIRDGAQKKVHLEKIVPGDLVILHAGDMIPGDGDIIENKDFFVDEASLTGESTPVEKRNEKVFMGSHVVSGMAKVVISKTGKETQFGKIGEHLRLRPPESSFEDGIRKFGYLLMKVTILLIGAIFVFNMLLDRPFLESFLFSLALAVGLTPQLLPAIISVNLAKGARYMAEQKVIVRRLSSIENFGAMNILCTDKTGTLTKGKIELHTVVDENNTISDKVFLYAYLNAAFQTGYTNYIDEAIISSKKLDISSWNKLDEIPYDFLRKRLSVLLKHNNSNWIITKGAVKQVLSICQNKDDAYPFVEEYHKEGLRVLAIACKEIQSNTMTLTDESNMTLVGFVVLADSLKPHIQETLQDMKKQGIALKIITGDNHLVARHIGLLVGLDHDRLLTGPEIAKLSDKALEYKAPNTEIFAEIEPNQKERIILALRKTGNVVGYLGDGINDITALHAADVGITVDSAVDVAKDTADIVLLHKDLSVLKNGVVQGRKTFINTLKYIFMATSANFGNMFSMAGASLFLPFLPLLPRQILLMNLLTDFPEMTIATDNVDHESITKPLHWNLPFIRNFMVVFGLISSIFDYCTFGILLYFLKANEIQFRTGWFLESVASAAIIVLVIRTKNVFYKSLPSPLLTISVITMIIFTMLIPYTFLASLFEFKPLPIIFYATIGAILILYIAFVEIAKKWFYKKFHL